MTVVSPALTRRRGVNTTDSSGAPGRARTWGDCSETVGRLQHPSLEGSGTPWVCAQESRQHPISLDTKPNKMTVAVMNLYGSFLSSSTQKV